MKLPGIFMKCKKKILVEKLGGIPFGIPDWLKTSSAC
jgi:hypothetical protein